MPFIVGTAGHIDHGKTALVRALTGQDTDRLKEEKARGISIDLGFARLDLPKGGFAGVVDVPGHERFIRNMLAGAHGIDLALFVVAADDGVMPQTEEHLDILHLLGVADGIVVITKSDLVNESRIAEVREDVEILTVGTALEQAPVMAVSSTTGFGIEALREEIERRLERAPARRLGRGFRLPVDRAFVMRGHGTVVTGTAVAGEITAGAAVRLLPSGEMARVRSVQVHGQEVERAERGQRIALNLAGVERTEIGRGDVVTDAGPRETTRRLDVRVEIRPLAKKPIPNRRRVRLHLGTAEVLARMVLLGDKAELAPRTSAYAQLVCEEPVVAVRGDRFILRSESADRTIGGGSVVHAFPPRHRARDEAVTAWLERIEHGDADERMLAFLKMDPELFRPPRWLAEALDVAVEELRFDPNAIERLPNERVTEAVTTREKWLRWRDSLLALVAAYHRDHPLLPGMEMELLRTQLPGNVAPKLFRDLLDRLASERGVVREESIVRLPEHRASLRSDEKTLSDRLERLLEAGEFTPPDSKQIAETLRVPAATVRELLQALERAGKVSRVSNDLFYAQSVLDRVRALVAERIRGSGSLGAADFRDAIHASRKFSIALLEYLDRTAFTIRVGDARKLRKG